MGGLLYLVQRGGAWEGCGPAQSPPYCSKCNSPPINGQCTNFILFDWHYNCLCPLKGHINIHCWVTENITNVDQSSWTAIATALKGLKKFALQQYYWTAIRTLVLRCVLRDTIFAWADSNSCLNRRIYKKEFSLSFKMVAKCSYCCYIGFLFIQVIMTEKCKAVTAKLRRPQHH